MGAAILNKLDLAYPAALEPVSNLFEAVRFLEGSTIVCKGRSAE